MKARASHAPAKLTCPQAREPPLLLSGYKSTDSTSEAPTGVSPTRVQDQPLEGGIPVSGEGFDIADVANHHLHPDPPQTLDGTRPAVCSEKSLQSLRTPGEGSEAFGFRHLGATSAANE
jgi:hypothetical protein